MRLSHGFSMEGGFLKWGTFKIDGVCMVYNMENPIQVDENWGYPYDSGNHHIHGSQWRSWSEPDDCWFFLFGKRRPGDAPSDPRPDRPGKNLRSPTGKTSLQTKEFAIENGPWPM